MHTRTAYATLLEPFKKLADAEETTDASSAILKHWNRAQTHPDEFAKCANMTTTMRSA